MKRLDEGGIDGDLCMLLQIGSYACVVWPTVEKLKVLERLTNVSECASA